MLPFLDPPLSRIVTPDRLPGLVAWYSADYGVLAAVGPDVSASPTDPIRRVLDRSGNGLHLDQTTTLNQPLFTNGGITGDGVNSYMAATFPTIAQPLTVMFVARNTATLAANASNYIFEASNGNQSFIANIYSTIGYAGRFTTYPVDATWLLPATSGNTVALGYVQDGAASIQQKGISVVKTNNTGTLGISSGEMAIMARSSVNSYVAKFTGSIYEIAFWSIALTQAQMNGVMRYFARKWGVAL